MQDIDIKMGLELIDIRNLLQNKFAQYRESNLIIFVAREVFVFLTQNDERT